MNIKTLIIIGKSSGDSELITLGNKLEKIFIASKATDVSFSLNPIPILEQISIITQEDGSQTIQNTSFYKELFEKEKYNLRKTLEDAIYLMENLDKGEEIFPVTESSK